MGVPVLFVLVALLSVANGQVCLVISFCFFGFFFCYCFCYSHSQSPANAPLAPWAIAVVALSSVGCAVAIALILFGVYLRVAKNSPRWGLITGGCILAALCSVSLVTTLVVRGTKRTNLRC
jgi:hypothetical protein